ncbi:hypothetical protein [Fluoribacter gormanii]|uniref:Uncharacterized protein n=1 Tax=Fluoribacter gormanii TaxID=464 RepID=A0A377GL57_9GAMM|nr:hypothetical protein [Fluoribacter gormanii]KTD01957.1 hypothetical protein Lgor_2070 [Fluoribacter gormanii]MCW8442861.1 hypothetical protein [Fluoribacter gormanii]SIR78715.1 hypothetical protein SAMN05421777_12463 [Fluoribacter gormanii]STO25536.1 Uncharacterised protein [Fluoribacter gormanii]
MQTKLHEEEKKAAKARYDELLAALTAMNRAQENLLFTIQPNPTLFEKLYEKDQVAPLYVEFVSKNSGAKFTIENKFFPHSWIVTTPENATKEELDFVRDLTLETIAHPQNAPADYQPKLLAFFPDNTPPEQIREFIKAAEGKGIEVNLFIGKKSEFDKITQEHSQKTKEAIESGNLDKLPGWEGYMKMINQSEGGKKGKEMLSKLDSEPTSSLSNN